MTDKTKPALPLIEDGRYHFNCSNGCGHCGVKLTEFERERTETLSGELVSRVTIPHIVSACCGSEVEVWDHVADAYMPQKVLAVTEEQLANANDVSEAEKITLLTDALETAKSGLKYFHDTYPMMVTECDHEAMALIDKALGEPDRSQG